MSCIDKESRSTKNLAVCILFIWLITVRCFDLLVRLLSIRICQSGVSLYCVCLYFKYIWVSGSNFKQSIVILKIPLFGSISRPYILYIYITYKKEKEYVYLTVDRLGIARSLAIEPEDMML